jgi:drug/metabolite transporter (DMT)-like permease
VCALATAALWSCSALIFAAAAARLGSVVVNIARLILALVLLGASILLFRLPTDLNSNQVFWLSASGVVGLALGDSFLFKAFQTIGARVSMLIMSSAPAISAVAAFLILGEGISLWGIIGMAVTLGGIFLVTVVRGGETGKRPPEQRSGVLYAFLGSAGQGIGLVLAKMAFGHGELNGFVAATLRILASLVVLIPILGITGRLARPFVSMKRDRAAFGLTAAGSFLGPFLGISFSLIAVANTSVGVAATIMATVPIIMLPLIWIVHHEQPTPRAAAGAVIAVAGVAILFLR